ncbi:MAG: transposase [Clostridia bacterium]|nr:transposase [Clostridia bacterium]MBR0217598.1 transposase [Clostridia bacterium]MBR0226720.1 transposase [Clostridia bacterium]
MNGRTCRSAPSNLGRITEDRHLQKRFHSAERHLVETFFLKLKEFRRVATRYDKLADRFLAFVHLACIRILLA